MADREIIAATLTSALLKKLALPGQTRVADGSVTADRIVVARHAVTLYETILGMLAAQPAQPS